MKEFLIAASRGGNSTNPGDRTPGIHTEQRLKINKDINKDIKPICINSKGGRNGIDGLQPSLKDRVYDSKGISVAITTSPFFMPLYLVEEVKE